MKVTRYTLAILAALAMAGIYGCGTNSTPTSVNTNLDGTAPSAPEDLGLTTTSSYYQLTWTPSPDADVAKYQVYHYQPNPSRDNAYELIGETTTASFTFNGGLHEDNPSFRVRAVDNAGNASAFSSVFTAPISNVPPSGGTGGNSSGDPQHRASE